MLRPLLFLLFLVPVAAEPIITSWFTENSGQYARIYPSLDEEADAEPVTSWIHPNGGAGQATPTYAGVHDISTTDTDNIYIRTSGLALHVMGPWYNNGNIFGNYPSIYERSLPLYAFIYV